MVEMLLNGGDFKDGHLAYMPQGTSVSSSELAFPVNADAYVSRYIKFIQHLSVRSFRYAGSGSIGFSDCEWLPFCTENVCVYWESDIVPHQVQFLHQVRYHASYAWDPGTMLLQYRSIWLLLLTEEKEKVTLAFLNIGFSG